MAAPSAASSDIASGDISLLSFIDLSQLICLNESRANTFKPIVASKARNSTGNFLLSDESVDEQLLLTIPFNQSVRIRSIVIQSGDSERGPKRIKLFTNRPSIGFEDVEVDTPAQELELTEEDVRLGNKIALRFVRFQAVNSLHIFVESNQSDAEATQVNVLDIFGVPVETTKDLSGLKKVEE